MIPQTFPRTTSSDPPSCRHPLHGPAVSVRIRELHEGTPRPRQRPAVAITMDTKASKHSATRRSTPTGPRRRAPAVARARGPHVTTGPARSRHERTRTFGDSVRGAPPHTQPCPISGAPSDVDGPGKLHGHRRPNRQRKLGGIERCGCRTLGLTAIRHKVLAALSASSLPLDCRPRSGRKSPYQPTS